MRVLMLVSLRNGNVPTGKIGPSPEPTVLQLVGLAVVAPDWYAGGDTVVPSRQSLDSRQADLSWLVR